LVLRLPGKLGDHGLRWARRAAWYRGHPTALQYFYRSFEGKDAIPHLAANQRIGIGQVQPAHGIEARFIAAHTDPFPAIQHDLA